MVSPPTSVRGKNESGDRNCMSFRVFQCPDVFVPKTLGKSLRKSDITSLMRAQRSMVNAVTLLS